jgi:copper chaperone CopZ
MTRRAPVLAAMLTVPLLLAGCSNAADKAAEKTVEKQLEAAGGDASVDINGDEIKVETSDGTVEAGTGKLPSGFPEADVPLVDGEVIVGVSTGDGFSVSVKYDGSVADGFAAASKALTGAGLAQEEGMPIGDNSGAFTGNGYSVLLTAADMGGQTAVNYIVAKD